LGGWEGGKKKFRIHPDPHNHPARQLPRAIRALLLGQLNANLVSAYLCSRAAVRRNSNAAGAGGRIVNVAARHALEPRARGKPHRLYGSAEKPAVAALTMALGEEIREGRCSGKRGGRAPSIMDTPANRKSMPKADFDAWPKVEEKVAAAIMFLASPENKVTRGSYRTGVRQVLGAIARSPGGACLSQQNSSAGSTSLVRTDSRPADFSDALLPARGCNKSDAYRRDTEPIGNNCSGSRFPRPYVGRPSAFAHDQGQLGAGRRLSAQAVSTSIPEDAP